MLGRSWACCPGGKASRPLLWARICHRGAAHHPWSLAVSGMLRGTGSGPAPGSPVLGWVVTGSDAEDAGRGSSAWPGLHHPPPLPLLLPPLSCGGHSRRVQVNPVPSTPAQIQKRDTGNTAPRNPGPGPWPVAGRAGGQLSGGR